MPTLGERIDDGAAAAPTRLRAHYFDSRGVFRVYEVSVIRSQVMIRTLSKHTIIVRAGG